MTITHTRKLLLAFGLAASLATSHAQLSAGSPPVGVLSHSYTEVSVGAQDIRHFSANFYDATLGGNLPVAPGVDVGGSYSYGWIRGSLPGHSNTLNAYTTAYLPMRGAKPFASVALGYQWTHFTGSRDSEAFWGAAVGVEIPVGLVSITPRVAYVDDFHDSMNSSQQTTYEVEANCWLTQRSALFATVGKTDLHDSVFDSWNYRVGVRIKF